jgi:rod shape-determining protein MreC
MAGVHYDSYQRGAMRRVPQSVSALHFFLMFLAAGLLILARIDHPASATIAQAARIVVNPLMSIVAEVTRPVRQVVHNAARYLTVESELERLERELATLRNLLERSSTLEARNQELARLARLVAEAPVDAVTVEVVGGRRGHFSQTVTVGAGQDEGLRYGQPVFSGDGLFGRITRVGSTTADVLMLSDNASRIAVEVGEQQRPALVVGDGTPAPRLVYFRADGEVSGGAKVVTSGASGAFPRGIILGHLAFDGDVARVRLLSSLLAGRYLTVMKHPVPAPLGGAGEPGLQAAEGGGRAAVVRPAFEAAARRRAGAGP